MMGLVIAIHVTICILLIGIILIQAGRGGGLVEGFSGVESMFGTKTSAFLTRSTTILSAFFFLTCVSLALLAARESRSLMKDALPESQKQEQPAQEAPKAEEKPANQPQEKALPEGALPKTE